MTEVTIQNPNGYEESRPGALRAWVESLVRELAPEADTFTLRFTGDRAMRRLNRDFRDKDASTDVLSFPGDDGPEGRHLGDVAISVPTARRQAAEHDEPVARELRRLILHGVLHCLGYDHETDDGQMERLETRLRREWLDHA